MAYDASFFDHVDSGAIRSAKAFVSALQPQLRARSVLDVGSGRGGWARMWQEGGAERVIGIDGDYVDRTKLHIDTSQFLVIDLVQPFDLQERFDIVQCLEVAEHLPEASARGLVDSLCRHGDIILFSAATPGQGGTHHINEQPLEFWRALFAAKGYRTFDFLRPTFAQNADVEPWYRFNSLLYVKESAVSALPASIRSTQLSDQQAIPEFSSIPWRVRKILVRLMPPGVRDIAAKVVLLMRGVVRRPG